MRKNYPLFSKELNDIFQELYYNLVFLLGYDNEQNERTYNGLYDTIERDIGIMANAIILQESNNTLSYKNESNNIDIPLFSKWGTYIVINELRRL